MEIPEMAKSLYTGAGAERSTGGAAGTRSAGQAPQPGARKVYRQVTRHASEKARMVRAACWQSYFCSGVMLASVCCSASRLSR